MRYPLRTLLIVLAIAVLLSFAFLAHVAATGIGVPYQDPTPAQVAHERFHSGISEPLFIGAGAAWLAVGVVAVLCVSSGLQRR